MCFSLVHIYLSVMVLLQNATMVLVSGSRCRVVCPSRPCWICVVSHNVEPTNAATALHCTATRELRINYNKYCAPQQSMLPMNTSQITWCCTMLLGLQVCNETLNYAGALSYCFDTTQLSANGTAMAQSTIAALSAASTECNG